MLDFCPTKQHICTVNILHVCHKMDNNVKMYQYLLVLWSQKEILTFMPSSQTFRPIYAPIYATCFPSLEVRNRMQNFKTKECVTWLGTSAWDIRNKQCCSWLHGTFHWNMVKFAAFLSYFHQPQKTSWICVHPFCLYVLFWRSPVSSCLERLNLVVALCRPSRMQWVPATTNLWHTEDTSETMLKRSSGQRGVGYEWQ